MHYYLIRTSEEADGLIRKNAEAVPGGLLVREGAYAAFCSKLIDAHRDNPSWAELFVPFEADCAATAELLIYSADEDFTETAAGGRQRISDVLADGGVTVQAKKEMLMPYLKKQVPLLENTDLTGIAGRYLWFLIEWRGIWRACPVRDIYVYFDRKGWENYLPEVYRTEGGDFLKRWLAMLQSIYEAVSESIAAKAAHFDPETADADTLEMLAQWLRFVRLPEEEHEALRRLLRRAPDLYRRKGTAAALKEAVSLYLNQPVELLEYQDLYENGKPKRPDAGALYEMDEYTCLLLIQRTEAMNQKRLAAVSAIAERMLPAALKLRIVLLEDGVSLGGYHYLGVNTSVETYRPLKLDGSAAVSYVRLLEER